MKTAIEEIKKKINPYVHVSATLALTRIGTSSTAHDPYSFAAGDGGILRLIMSYFPLFFINDLLDIHIAASRKSGTAAMKYEPTSG